MTLRLRRKLTPPPPVAPKPKPAPVMDDSHRIMGRATRVAQEVSVNNLAAGLGITADAARAIGASLQSSIRNILGTGCEDEGCPHYGTPHSHGTDMGELVIGDVYSYSRVPLGHYYCVPGDSVQYKSMTRALESGQTLCIYLGRDRQQAIEFYTLNQHICAPGR